MRIIEKVRGYRSAAINALIDAVRAQRLVPGPGLRAAETPSGTILTLEGRPLIAAVATAQRLSVSLAGATCTVAAGSVRFHGIGTANVVESSIECAMSPMWVSVAVARDALSASIVATSTEPSSDYTTLYLPLVVVEQVTTGEDTIWRITETCHTGDFDFDLPLR